jgi:parallel beta-helix repeat protein
MGSVRAGFEFAVVFGRIVASCALVRGVYVRMENFVNQQKNTIVIAGLLVLLLQQPLFAAQTQGKNLNVPKDFATIQAAMDAAKAGDTVLVWPGEYAESIVFKDGVRLVGTDAEKCRILPAPGAVSLLTAIDCKSVRIEKLTFDGQGKAEPRPFRLGFATAIEKDETLIAEVAKNGPAWRAGLRREMKILKVNARYPGSESCLSVYAAALGAKANTVHLLIDGERIQIAMAITSARGKAVGSFPDGIVLIHSGGSVTGSRFTRLTGSGIVVVGGRKEPLVIRANRCDKNNIGIQLVHGGKAIVEKNLCESNSSAGIDVNDRDTAPLIKGNTCSKNAGFGIRFGRGASGIADGNTCESNGSSGIGAMGDSAPTITGNTCRSNTKNGISISTGAKSKVVGNICELNSYSGVTIYGLGTDPILKENICRNNKNAGIYISKRASPKIDGNICEENGNSGIIVFDKGTHATLIGNRCAKNKRDGIFFSEGAGGLVRDNTCEANSDTGISIYGRSTSPIIKQNICEKNIKAGMYFGRGARPNRGEE